MNSFRVVDTRFRILKGGKIGLSMSIALIGGMLTLGSTKAVATDYFTGVSTNTSGTSSVTTGAFDITVQTGINSGTTSEIRTTFLNDNFDSVVIKPTSWTTSYYAPTFIQDNVSPNSSTYALNRTNSPLVLNLTFDTSANALDITKIATTLYSAPASGSVNINVNTTYPLTNVVSSSYTANLIFNGSNVVSGNTDIDDGNIQLNGSATFVGTIEAGSINLNAGTSEFQDTVTATTTTISGGIGNFNTVSGNTTSNIVFTGSGTANLNGNLTGSITTNGANQGTVTTTGLSQTITGNIGTSISSGLSTLNIGSSTDATNYSSTTIAGNVFANSTVLNNNGSTNSSTLTLTNGSNITSNITTADSNMGILTLLGSSTVTGTVGTTAERLNQINSGADTSSSTFTGDIYAVNISNTGTGTTIFQNDVTATNVNVNAGTTTFQDNLTATTTTISTGTGNFNTVSGSTNSNIVFNNTGTANLYGDLTGNVTTTANNQGTLTVIGSISGKNQTINGNIGTSSSSDLNTLNIGETGVSSKYTVTTINGNIYANNTVLNNGTTASSELILASGNNITSTITTADDGKGILTLVGGTQTVTGTVGTSGSKLANVNAGANGATSTFSNDVNATNLNVTGTGAVNLNGSFTGTAVRYNADGIVNLVDNQNINANIVNNAGINNQGTLNLLGDSTVTGTVGVGNALKDVNSGVTGTTSTFAGTVNSQNITNTGTGTTIFQDDVNATNVNVNAGTSNFQDNLTAISTTITTGIGNFNTLSGTTSSNIVFTGDGTANLNEGLIGNIYFSGNDTIVNVSDGKGILGSVETLANNTGILNFKGDGVIDGIIGSAGLAIKELNVNSEDEQDKDGNGTVITQGLLAHREIFAEIINLRNNATLTLANNANVTKTSTGLVISTDSGNSGNVVFLGSSTVTGEVGTNNNYLESITAGADNETVTFNDMVYASILNYSDEGTVVLNGDNSSNANAEGFKGTVNFDSFAGKLEIGDDVNLTIGTAGTQFVNANNATLTFNGTSNVLGNIGSENGVNDTFKTINAGASNETVKFEDNVYVMDSLNLSSNGKVQIADGNYVKRNSNSTTTGAMITTSTNGFGDLEYLGSTILHSDIGTSSSKLNNVTFASTGNTSNIYNQDIDKNIYALNTYIGNGSNKTTLNIKEDITFGGNLNLRKDSVLNVSDYNVTVDNNLNIASNSTLNFKVYTTDISAGQAVENGNSGKITAQSLIMANDAKIHIDYDGTWEGAGKYNLINASSITTDYYGTEKNGLVSDNSIIDSIVTKDGTNLTLFADRTSGGSFNPEDLYIEKSEIGKDYSNGASQSLAGYANEKDREGALADIIREMEYFEGGTNLSEAKKQEMIKMQRLLAPTANNSNIQSTITATNLSASTIKGRLSDIRVTQGNNFTPNTYNYLGLSSGDYYSFDTSFWLKAMASKATQDKIKEYDGYDSSTYGFVGGMDKITNDGSIFGVALSYSTTKTKQDGLRTDDSDTTSVQATLYSSQEIGDAYVDGYLSYGKHKTDATRTANSGKLNSSVNSDQISAKVETGYKIPLNDGISLTPFASLEYSLLNQKGYTEKGTTYQNDALKVDSIKLNRGTAEVGAKLVTNIEFDDTLIIPQFSASVYNSFGDNKPDVKAQFVGGGNKFVTPVPMMNDTMINLGLGVETKISDSTSLIFDVDYDRSKDGKFEAYSGSVTFGVSF